MARRRNDWAERERQADEAVAREWERRVRRWVAVEAAVDALHEELPKAVGVLVTALEHGEPKDQLAVATLLLRWMEQHGQSRPTLLTLSFDSERRDLAAIAATVSEGNVEDRSQPD
jgi:hypothetical protein